LVFVSPSLHHARLHLLSSDSYSPPASEGKLNISKEEREKSWYDLDDHRKKQLEVGGGLFAGAAAITAGYFAYQKHEKNKEEVPFFYSFFAQSFPNFG
jgi:hypothetical protein